ncbi:DUF1963 domain-containing protein [Streptomyces sp. M92]|uniref:DUF1963 domain-containing protein n=1 Tax=Streptomyces sp. M92 TaxID=2944250 RepID=UPI00234BA2F0|nr:DUF1963 domain-containing protein [Streptomyces sp. M92]WCN05440.1 DUF1963 domain-containing protein [Streptomyces sp. M92]
MLDRLNRVRESALARGVPPAEVERWLEAARPCATLTPDGDGPVVGRFGGPLLLPVEFANPPARTYLIASMDLAAPPADATTLPLPSDGVLHLLARSADDGFDAGGEAVYVPAGTPVEERPLSPRHSPRDPWANMGRGPHEGTALRLRREVSLPDCEAMYAPAEHPHAAELRDAWRSVRDEDRSRGRSLLRIDGYARDPYGEFDMLDVAASLRARRERRPPGESASAWAAPRPEDWALLTQWYGGVYVHGDVYWTVTRKNLAERRFDEVDVLGCIEGPA